MSCDISLQTRHTRHTRHTRAYEQASQTLDRLLAPVAPAPATIPALSAPDPERPWAPGAEWGQSRRVRPINGIHWEMECECGNRFVVSTNDSTPDSERKCQVCRERDELALAAERLNQLATALNSGELVAVTGRFVQAQKLWEKYHKYVHSRVWAEVRPYVGGKEYGLLDDVEHAVWERVASKVEDFRGRDRRAEMSWLKLVTRSVVTDHFRFEYRQKQDQRKTVAIPGDDCREMSNGPLPDRPTANADYLNGESGDSEADSTVLSRKGDSDAARTQEWARAGIR
jgi:hypothetical protein